MPGGFPVAANPGQVVNCANLEIDYLVWIGPGTG